MFSLAISFLCTILVIQSIDGTLITKRQLPGLLLLNFDETLCHPEPTPDLPQYIIGFGGFIKEESKNEFYSGAGESIPIRVKGFGRHWNVQKPAIGFGTTYIGSVVDPSATLNGVAFTIPSGTNVTQTLLDQDTKQNSFCRQKVPLYAITRLTPEEKNLEKGDYWIYVTRTDFFSLPNPTYPIVQSYVDEFMIGCLDVGKKHNIPTFADECVESTFGWERTWVNDRIFPRRPSVKQPRAPEIDKVLATRAPLGFSLITIEG